MVEGDALKHTMEANILSVAKAQLNTYLDVLSGQFVGRRALLELLILGIVTREHVLLIGPPGTGKSATCLLYTSPSPRDRQKSRMPSSA